MARPVPMPPMVNITRNVYCMAVVSVSVACAGSAVVSANNDVTAVEIVIGGECLLDAIGQVVVSLALCITLVRQGARDAAVQEYG